MDHESTVICGLAVQYFQLLTIHSWQKKVISAAINNRDTLVIQPTGSGKSLCYMIPPFYRVSTAVIISPTISLMMDQVTKHNNKGINATFLGSAQKEIINQLDQFRLVFTTPESFFDSASKRPHERFLQFARERKLCLVAIDEGHVICSWKSSRYETNNATNKSCNVKIIMIHRPDYEYVMNMSSSFSELPIMILTATATVEVKEVFQRILRQPIQEVASVNRSNVS